MKNIFILISISSTVFAQDNFSVYNNAYTLDDFEIKIDAKDTAKYTLYVDAYSLDKSVDDGGFMLTNKTIEGFISNIKQAKAKYSEWVAVAKQNNVTELNKKIDISTQGVDSYFRYGSKWRFDFSVNPSFHVWIKDGPTELKYLLMVKTGEITASDNEFMDSDGFIIIFSNEEEIDKFLETISVGKIKSFASAPKTEDLFKD